MKAAHVTQYGSPEVVTIQEVAQPQPKDDEILVRIHSSAVTAADVRIRAARFPKGFGLLARLAFGYSKPRNAVLGNTFSGVVEAAGANVTEFQVGDEVCGMTGTQMGTHAEYLVISQNKAVVKKPKAVSHQDAAGVLFGGTTALYFLRDKGQIGPGQQVLIHGASGAVGSNAVQLAKHLGAKVTAATRPGKTDFVARLGADRVVDYTKETAGGVYDLVLDTSGRLSVSQGKALLKPQGKLVLIAGGLPELLRSLIDKQLIGDGAPERKENIAYLLSLVESKALKVVNEEVYPFENVVKAHQHVDEGKSGNVLLQF
ncbi:MAG: NAD(P)-dependent alcohol dehydrogenase [Anaerolineales bacterium]|nr:NAD(P)-dependent alcohol dehydrogenase [Anaerolineales bacterium]